MVETEDRRQKTEDRIKKAMTCNTGKIASFMLFFCLLSPFGLLHPWNLSPFGLLHPLEYQSCGQARL